MNREGVVHMKRIEAQGRGFLTGNSRRVRMRPSGIVPRPTHGTGRQPTLRMIGALGPACPASRPRRPAPVKREVGPIEQGHINYQPYFKAPIVDHREPTYGTIAPSPFDRLIERSVVLQHIFDTQCCSYHAHGGTEPDHSTDPQELETVAQELTRNGLPTINLSSSSGDMDDDDSLDAAIALQQEHIGYVGLSPDADPIDEDTNRDARRYGTPGVAAELAPIVRRIEWEQFMLACSQITRIFLAPKPEGGLTIKTDDKRVTKDDLLAAKPVLAAMLAGRRADDLMNDRARVKHYGVLGSILYGIKNGEHAPIQSFDDLGADDWEKPAGDGAPEELNIHSLARDYPDEYGTGYRVLPEPTERELWPEFI